jgi:hypothetical protein
LARVREAQRYNGNEYEWLRDVHVDALDRQQIKLFTFLVVQLFSRSFSHRRPACRSPERRTSSRD